uniref:Hl2 n=1 Tax=Nematostella vectensis TaxID=45351 RepID=G9JWJ2_NEMVE|nr:Hl2 [Nematostella vectensis]
MAQEKHRHLDECCVGSFPKVKRRRIMKPITERLRRERINSSLKELKFLVLSALGQDVSRYSRMEKADILEMTVSYIRKMQRKSNGQDVTDFFLPLRCRSLVQSSRPEPHEGTTTSHHATDAHVPTRHSTLKSPNNDDVTSELSSGINAEYAGSAICSLETKQNFSPQRSTAEASQPMVSIGTHCPPSNSIVRIPDLSGSPLATISENSTTEWNAKSLSPLKKRLPGMECFIRGRMTLSEDKENFDQSQRPSDVALPPRYRLFSPVWRPWH